MPSKLDSLYDREEQMKKEINKLVKEYNQLQEDKEMAQTFIMYESNKNHRRRMK